MKLVKTERMMIERAGIRSPWEGVVLKNVWEPCSEEAGKAVHCVDTVDFRLDVMGSTCRGSLLSGSKSSKENEIMVRLLLHLWIHTVDGPKVGEKMDWKSIV